MQLRGIFVTITTTLAAIAIAAPAGAQLKCKAKQNKKTGVIEYSFVNKAGGTVVFSYSDLESNLRRPHYTTWVSFANESICQANGRGKRCVVSNDAAEAAVAPAGCKIYMADLASGDKCELYISGCQPALRPPPTTGYHIPSCPELECEVSDAGLVWDAETGIAWFKNQVPNVDNQAARTLDGHKIYLADVVNGGKSDGTDFACLTDGCNLELPTLAQLQKLGDDCAAVAVQDAGTGDWTYATSSSGPGPELCSALWPDPTLGEPANCAWSSTVDVAQPNTHAYGICLQPSGAGISRATMVEYILIVAMTVDLPAAVRAVGYWIVGDGEK
jgi:hypothetical protein